jgi:DNA-binding SARP family transcriptional activator
MRSHPRRTTAPEQHDQQLRGDSRRAATGTPEVVRVELLGGFRLWVGPRVIDEGQWRLRMARSLVKLLALAPGHHLHREQVMDALWPGLEPGFAANNLHQILHAARRAFEPSALSSGSASSGYLLLREEQLSLCPESPLWVDAEAFQEEAATARHAMEPHAFRAAARAAATTRQTAQKAHPTRARDSSPRRARADQSPDSPKALHLRAHR